MMKIDALLMVAASLLLLVVNGLVFHDIRDAHTFRDWIMLVASALVLFQFARQFWNRRLRHS